jgi:hypothetical protein
MEEYVECAAEMSDLVEERVPYHHVFDVVIVGNGPAALALSAFLSGTVPIYNGNPHPNPAIQQHLRPNANLFEADLSWYEEECADRITPGIGAYADLYDTLVRPQPFLPAGERGTTCLKFAKEAPLKQFSVPHIVLGEGPIGGSWATYDEDMVTLSRANWMDLPGFSTAQWLGGEPLVDRLPSGVIRRYFQAYAKKMGIRKNFKTNAKVTNITKSTAISGSNWQVRYEHNGEVHYVYAKNVVLACGRSQHRLLEVEGELTERNIVYDVKQLKSLLSTSDGGYHPSTSYAQHSAENRGVVVVGDGISAADAVIHCLSEGIPVCHVFRRTEKQLRTTTLARLSPLVYPEYANLFRLMMGLESNPIYQRMPSTCVKSIQADSVVELATPDGEILKPFSCLAVCVGLRSEMPMLDEKCEFLSNYQCATDPTLFAVGSLGGDHFVRYLVGGCLHVAKTLTFNRDRRQKCQLVNMWMSIMTFGIHPAFDCTPFEPIPS